jgi:hypothetical protein
MRSHLIQKMWQLWKQFLPLSVSDVTMAAGDPAVNAALSMSASPQPLFAGLGVAKSIAIFFESPIIMILHASNKLAEDANAAKAMWRFMLLCGLTLTLCLILINLPPVFNYLAKNIFNLTEDIAVYTHIILSCFIFWPAMIAWRRYFQGILIHVHQMKPIVYGGFLRLIVLITALFAGYFLGINPALTTGIAMILGVFSEAIFVTLYGWNYKKAIFSNSSAKTYALNKPHTLKQIFKFYWPLAHSMVLVWGGRALLIVIIAHAIDPNISLAVWPVAWALVLLFANASRMIQQVVIKNKNAYETCDYFIFGLSVGGILSLCIFLLVLTPASEFILDFFIGYDNDFNHHICNVLLICALTPILVAIQNILQGFLIIENKTKEINMTTLYGVAVLLILSSVGIFLDYSGALVASLSTIISLGVETLFLYYFFMVSHYGAKIS